MNSFNIIWNISLVCPWDCAFCCTDAVKVNKIENMILINENKKVRTIGNNEKIKGSSLNLLNALRVKSNYFDIALQDRQNRGLELRYDEKMKILNNIDFTHVKLDFAGGDPLACFENFIIIKKAAELFGKENISVTTTGYSLNRYNISEIEDNIGKIEFTYDELHLLPKNRPKGYNLINLKTIKKFAERGIKTRAQIPLHDGNIGCEFINKIYLELHNIGIKEILLMRLFPVGRGSKFDKELIFNQNVYRTIIDNYRRLENKYTLPKVNIQCALKHILKNNANNPCDALIKSLGINPLGKLLVCAWANGDNCMPLDDSFIIYDIKKGPISRALKTDKIIAYNKQLNDNFGHCKVFSYLYSNSRGKSIFSRNDPLYSNLKK